MSSQLPFGRLVHRVRLQRPAIIQRVKLSTTSSDKTPFYGEPRSHSSHNSGRASFLRNLGVAITSAGTAFSDPARADAVAALAEVTGHVSLTQIHDRMKNDATGQRILQDRPIVSKDTLPIDDLIASADDMEDGSDLTFGKAYGAFLKGHGFDPDERDQVRYIDEPDLAYVMLRYRQCHDFWHVLTGLPPTVLGELGLKWLELLQTGLPVAALSATVGSLRLDSDERKILNEQYLPWAVRVNDQSAFLLNVYYEEELDTSLSELRRRLGVEPAPQTTPSNNNP